MPAARIWCITKSAYNVQCNAKAQKQLCGQGAKARVEFRNASKFQRKLHCMPWGRGAILPQSSWVYSAQWPAAIAKNNISIVFCTKQILKTLLPVHPASWV
jgi:hypothetical protein